MACEDRMKITGWMERDLTGDPIDPNDIGPFVNDFATEMQEFVRRKFTGLCAAGCEEKSTKSWRRSLTISPMSGGSPRATLSS